ncbi:MAG: ankyrin repeat domain-containing protein [Magnetococcales bacterium]|nr:ankyrin repeat domain-containing protein [Magnetococcales bacterium]
MTPDPIRQPSVRLNALQRACRDGDPAAVERLLAAGAEIEATSINGLTPLLYAVRQHRVEIIRLLMARGANLHAVSAAGVGLLAYLVQKPPRLKRSEWETQCDEVLAILMGEMTHCADDAELALLQTFIDCGVSLQTMDSVGDTPLSYAAFCGNAPAVRLLLAAGAEAFQFTDQGMSPLAHAIQTESLEVIRLLLAQARKSGILTAIGSDPRYHRLIDRASPAVIDALDRAIGGIRQARAEREEAGWRELAGEEGPRTPGPIEVYWSPRLPERVLLSRGPLLKFCLNCRYTYNNFFDHGGMSRYGLVGGYCYHPVD